MKVGQSQVDSPDLRQMSADHGAVYEERIARSQQEPSDAASPATGPGPVRGLWVHKRFTGFAVMGRD